MVKPSKTRKSMAKIIYEVYQNQNEHNAAFGKWYGRVKYLESLNTRKLSNHIAEHGSIYTPDVVYGVMEKFRSCLLEMLLNSKKVKIDGLGTFYTTLECKKGGAVTKDKFSVLKDIKGLHIRFLPEQEQEQNISSREFLKQAEFINVDSLTKKEEEESGTTGNGSTNSGNGGSQSGEQGGNQNGGSQSGEQSVTLAAPTISGTTPFAETTSVSISGPDGAEIHYTTDGSAPTAESTLYSEAFTLSDTTTVKAIAIKDGESSEVASKLFTKGEGGDEMDQN
jgi:predicted histone-like DNA-binding protein